ncbi:hypothetical protein BDV95DRAFT_71878 [Massariosphaeria phaeospora]|uniref:Uncharacterized protein n=1 Tax=Massariosphaeria phaeospora TaxID=100035 RepID=A0A7C8MI59_9PLEO|nr:hypothetical protein BDV95DRAFT_71878 [Massariosphaeria phaeospora]
MGGPANDHVCCLIATPHVFPAGRLSILVGTGLALRPPDLEGSDRLEVLQPDAKSGATLMHPGLSVSAIKLTLRILQSHPIAHSPRHSPPCLSPSYPPSVVARVCIYKRPPAQLLSCTYGYCSEDLTSTIAGRPAGATHHMTLEDLRILHPPRILGLYFLDDFFQHA